MPPYPTRSYVRAHPSFQLDGGDEIATGSPTKRSPTKRSPSRKSPSKQSPTKRSQRSIGVSKRPKVKVTTFPTLREGSVQPTPQTIDPTTPQTWGPPASQDLGWAPKKLKRASAVGVGNDGSKSWLAVHKGVTEDVSPLTSMAPGKLPTLPEMEVEDEPIMQREYVRLMNNRDTARKFQEQWGRENKENRTTADPNPGSSSMAIDQGASSAVSSDCPAAVRGVRRTDTEEIFN